MNIKRKKCKYCEKLSLPGRAICYDHWRERQKALRLASEARKMARKAKKQAKEHNSYRWLHKRAWELFSLHIRSVKHVKDTLRCYTCGKELDSREAQAGHYFHSRLDFDTRNIHPQCQRCNHFLRGNLAVYAVKLVEDGVDLKVLRRDAETKKYSCQELRDIISKYNPA